MQDCDIVISPDDLEIGIVYSICCDPDVTIYYKVCASSETRYFVGGSTHDLFLLEKDNTSLVDMFTFLYDDIKILISEIELFNWGTLRKRT